MRHRSPAGWLRGLGGSWLPPALGTQLGTQLGTHLGTLGYQLGTLGTRLGSFGILGGVGNPRERFHSGPPAGSGVFEVFVRGELVACVGTTGGRFGTGAVTDASGAQTHRLTIHSTPFVTHVHVFDMEGALHWKCTRASLPPSELWLFEPRAETHDVGGCAHGAGPVLLIRIWFKSRANFVRN